jgi:hypothetical protein
MVTVPGTTTQIDAMSTLDATIFTSDGKYTVANNTKCDASEDDPVDSGTWSLNADKNALTVDSSTEDPFTITNLVVGWRPYQRGHRGVFRTADQRNRDSKKEIATLRGRSRSPFT